MTKLSGHAHVELSPSVCAVSHNCLPVLPKIAIRAYFFEPHFGKAIKPL